MLTSIPGSIFNNESIEYQHNSAFFQSLVYYYKNKSKEDNTLQELSDIINKYTNLNVKVIKGRYWAASILMLGENHVLFKDIFQQYKEVFSDLDTEADLKKAINNYKIEELKGWIDRKQSKVHGIYKKLQFNMWVNTKDINEEHLTYEEKAAITLHEVGHMFTTLEMLGNITLNNFAIVNSIKAMGFKQSHEKDMALMEYSKYINASTNMFAITEAKNSVEGFAILVSGVSKNKTYDLLSNMLEGNTYYTTNSEWVADDFAVKHGAAVHLVSGLNKIIDKSDTIRVATNIITIATHYMLPIILGMTLSFMTIAPILIIANLYIGVMSSAKDQLHKRYDFDSQRFKKIRNNLISQIRSDDKMSKQQLSEIMNSIDMIEQYILNVKKEKPITIRIYDYVASLIDKKTRQSVVAEMTQNKIEELMNNPLYVQSIKLANSGK